MACRSPAHLGLFAAGVLLALVSAARATAGSSAYDLHIEHSPIQAGTVTPDSGMHRFPADTVVTLSAEPQQGYEFAHWLGDVADPTAQCTTVRIDAPKLVVAVFRPVEKNPLEETIRFTGGGGGPLTPTVVYLSAPGLSAAGGAKAKPDTPVTPIHTPEPATVLLLALGTLALRRRSTT